MSRGRSFINGELQMLKDYASSVYLGSTGAVQHYCKGLDPMHNSLFNI